MKYRFRKKASALVTTLFVVVVLSTIVLAFMASMSLERKISGSMKNKFQAELMAEAGMNEFLSRLENIKTDGPYSAVYVLGPNTNPYLFLGKRLFSSNGTATKRIPLFSTSLTNFSLLTNFSAPFLSSTPIVIGDKDRSGGAISRTLTSSNDIWCDINKTNAQFPSGLVGLRNTFTNTNSIPLLSANWVYMKNSTGKVIGRYAYWADDECSKIDIRYAGSPNNLTGNHTRLNGASLSDLALTPLTKTPAVTGNFTANLTTANLANLLAFTNTAIQALPFSPAHAQYDIASSGNLTAAQWRSIRPYVTIYSLHDDRSLDGKRKINLNQLISSSTTALDIQRQTFSIRDAITNNLPSFGKRFYSAAGGITSNVTTDHQKLYATRIAANIRDFIDTDANGTFIQQDDTAFVGNGADFMVFDPTAQQDTDLPAAFGKDSQGLHLSEYSRVVRVLSVDGATNHPTPGVTPRSVRFRFGHYVELINTSPRSINTDELGNELHIKIAGRPRFNNIYSNNYMRFSDLKMRLPSGISIPPRGIITLTTDGEDASVGGGFHRDSQSNLLGSSSGRHQLTFGTNAGQWTLVNTNGNMPKVIGSAFEEYIVTTTATNDNRYAVRLGEKTAGVTYTDQTERLLLANSTGILDCAFRIYTVRSEFLGAGVRNPSWVDTFLNDPESSTANNAPNANTSDPRYSRADFRGNFDMVSVVKKSTALSWKDGTHTSPYGTGLPGSQSTLGSTNYNYHQISSYTGDDLWRKGWYEYTTNAAGNVVINNTNLFSIGQLGGVYDPIRHDIEGYRSMGATLRIGQSDSPTNNRGTSSNLNFMNWLGGRGSDSATNAAYAGNAFLLTDVFRTDTNLSGRINPNSIIRDGTGLVFSTALQNFIFESAATNGSEPKLSGATLNISNTIREVRNFATNSTNGFLVSLGDISRVPIFWSTNLAPTSQLVPGKMMSQMSDSGKEEFFRRTANLMTTQSLAFSVYVVGQSGEISQKNGTDVFLPTGTQIYERVIQLLPEYPTTNPWETVEPTNWSTLTPHSIGY